jgi:hypothetical protein
LVSATYTKISGYREILWFDGSRRYVGNMETRRKKYKITKDEKEQLFEFLDKHNFPFEYDINNRKILEMINVYILFYNNWKIKNKYTEYANKLRKMGLDSLVNELIRNYKLASQILKQKKRKIDDKKRNNLPTLFQILSNLPFANAQCFCNLSYTKAFPYQLVSYSY